MKTNKIPWSAPRFLVAVGLLGSMAFAGAQEVVNITNASFELPDITTTAPYFQAFPGDDGASTGLWQGYGPFNAVVATGHYGATPAGIAGSQFGDLSGQAGGGVFQDAAPYDGSGDPDLYWQAGYKYTLTAGFFTRSDNMVAPGNQLDLKFYYRTARNGGASVLSNTHIVGSQVNSTNMTDKTMTVTVLDGDPSVGKPIGIWLDSVVNYGGDWGYDNVRLTRVPAEAPPAGGLVLTTGEASPELTLDPPNVVAALHFGNDNTTYSLQGVDFVNVPGRPNHPFFTVTGFVPGVEGDGFHPGMPVLGSGTENDNALGYLCNSFYFGSDTTGGFNFLISGLSPYSTNQIDLVHYIGGFGPRETIITVNNGGTSLSETNFEVNGKPLNSRFAGIVADGSGSITGRFQGLTDGAWINALVVTFQGQGPIPVYTWSGKTNGVPVGDWDINHTANWLLSIDGNPASPSVWSNGVITRFDDSASSTTVNETTTLAPISLTVSNESKDFTFAGSGSIVGPKLVKQGGGTLTVLSPNTFGSGGNGNSVIENGAVIFGGNGTNSISGSLEVAATPGAMAAVVATNNADLRLGDALLLATGTGSAGTIVVAGNAVVSKPGGYVSIGLRGSGNAMFRDDAVFNGGTGDFNVSDLPGSDGTFTMQDNARISAGSVFVGKSAGCLGTVTQTGGNLSSVNGEFQVGTHGQGTWNQSGGTNTSAGWVSIGRYYDAIGMLYVSGNASLSQTNLSRDFLVGEEGTGYLTLSNSATVTSASTNRGLVIGPSATSVGYVNLDGGTLVANQVSGGPGGSLVYFNGGTLKAGPAARSNFVHDLNIGGFTDNAYISAGGAFIDSGGQNIGITTLLIENSMSPGGGLTKLGSGTLLLNGVNSYTGTTTVSAGTLGGSGSILGAVTVNPGAALCAGNGLATGAGLTVGSVTLNGTVVANVSRDGGSPMADVLNVNTPVAYHGELRVVNVGAAPLLVGDTFTVFSAAGYSGVFSSTNTTSAGQFVKWHIDSPSSGQITVASVTSSTVPTLTNSVSGRTLTLGWPAANIGWTLQAQTNSLSSGLGSNWVNVPVSDTANSKVITIDPAGGCVFYRLIYQ